MSNLNDENTRAVARQGHDRIVSFLNFFSKTGATYAQAEWANPPYLEQVKVDLVMLASCIETELREAYAVPAEDHA